MKSSVLCKRLTGLRLLFIILRSCHVLPNPPTKNEGRRHLMKPTFCCSLSLPSLWSLWRRGCDRSWVEWSSRFGRRSHQWTDSPAQFRLVGDQRDGDNCCRSCRVVVTTVAWRQTDLEDVGPEGGVGELEDVAGPHQVEPRLVLVHWVQNGLETKMC